MRKNYPENSEDSFFQVFCVFLEELIIQKCKNQASQQKIVFFYFDRNENSDDCGIFQ